MSLFRFNPIMLALGLSALSGPLAAELYTPKAVVTNDGRDTLLATVRFATPVNGDLYVAVMVDGQLLFFADNGLTFSPAVLPFQAGQNFSADVTVLNLNSNGIPAGQYPMYQVVTTPGSDPLNFQNWIGGPSALSVINFSIGLPVAIHGDFDGNGFADDDANQDGFHDDDLNKDGFHDDDLNQDGYHDDDLNFNGISDALENTGPNGQALYETETCASSACHGTNPARNQNGVLAGQNPNNIRNAINRNKGGMGFLNYLSDAELQAIADYLQTF
jgi:hypothetical protein